jgi:8-oxo-dGTP pyrophosphatase MutT (NUDIX family)
MNIICNNCGKIGHTFNQCSAPITSYGIIIFRFTNSVPEILMINRNKSLCYIEFIRGKYTLNNISYIQLLVDKMSDQEKHTLLKNSFQTLWENLWQCSINDISEHIQSDYSKGFKKFMNLKEGYLKNDILINLDYLIENTSKHYLDTEWEFPKGRRELYESNKQCAIREFEEETNYTINDYQLIDNMLPINEEFKGENKISYKYIYYLGYLTNNTKECSIYKNNKFQVSEIKNIQWLTKSECLDKLRDYHITRKKVIIDIFDLLQQLNKNFFIV